MGFSFLKRLKGTKRDSGDAGKSVNDASNLTSGKGMKSNSKKEDKIRQKKDKRRLKLILKKHSDNVLLALRDAVTQGISLDVQLLLNSPQKQPLGQADWEGILLNMPANVTNDILVLLLDNCPPTINHSDSFLWDILEITVDHQLWEQAASYSKQFSSMLLLRRVQSVLQSGRETELWFLLQEFPALIKLLDPVLELPGVPRELACATFRTLLLKPHNDNLSAAIADACQRKSFVDLEYLVTVPSMNSLSSRNWIRAIKSAVDKKCPEVLSWLIDRAPADGFVRVYFLSEIRRSIHFSPDAARVIFTKYIEKYSVIGLWNNIELDEEWLLRFYLTIRPSYIKEVANTVDGEDVLHFLLSNWDDVDVLRAAFSAKDVDIEAPFKIRTAKTLSRRGIPTMFVQVGKPGDTPLLRAVRMGLVDVVNLLLSKGANINATDSSGYTALHIAAQVGNLPMAQLIISKSTNFGALTCDGASAAGIAAANSRFTILELLEEKDQATLRNIEPASEAATLTPNIYETSSSQRPKQELSNSNTSQGWTMYPDRIILESRPRPHKYVLQPSDPAYWN